MPPEQHFVTILNPLQYCKINLISNFKFISDFDSISEKFSEVTIFFSDIVTFTTIASASTPMDIVAMLNSLYEKFDKLTNIYDVYKVSSYIYIYIYLSLSLSLNSDIIEVVYAGGDNRRCLHGGQWSTGSYRWPCPESRWLRAQCDRSVQGSQVASHRAITAGEENVYRNLS